MRTAAPLTGALALGGALLAATPAPARAEEPPAPPGAVSRAPLDVTAHLRATGDGVVLDLGGAHLELRASGAPLADVPRLRDPGEHEVRALVDVDGRTTHLLLRFRPPPGADAPPGAPDARP